MLTEGQQLAPAKEKVDQVAQGLVKIAHQGVNQLLPVVTLDEC